MKTKNNTTFPQTIEIPQPLEVHPSVSPKAAALLEGVIEVLMKEPQRYHQLQPSSHCGSPCCIVGHMQILSAGDDLGLTPEQFNDIYYTSNWINKGIPGVDEHYNKQGCAGHNLPASIGIARIEHFLRTGE